MPILSHQVCFGMAASEKEYACTSGLRFNEISNFYWFMNGHL